MNETLIGNVMVRQSSMRKTREREPEGWTEKKNGGHWNRKEDDYGGSGMTTVIN